MSVGLYDEHIDIAITRGLRRRGVDVLTVQEDDRIATEDALLLDRSADLGRVLFTHDDDFLQETAFRQRNGVPFAGVIYVHQRNITIGRCIELLEALASIGEPKDFANQVTYL